MSKEENLQELNSLLRLGPLTGLSSQTIEAIKEATIAYEEQAIPLSVINEIKADIEELIKTYERNYSKDLGMIFGLKNALELIDQNVKEYIK